MRAPKNFTRALATAAFATLLCLTGKSWAQQDGQPVPPAEPQAPQFEQKKTLPADANQVEKQPQVQQQDQGKVAVPDQPKPKIELGVRTMPSQTRGVLVGDIKPGGVADQAGIHRGDYLLAIGAHKIGSADDVTRALADKAAGEEITIEVWRDGATQKLTAELQEASPDSQAQSGRPAPQVHGARRHTAMRPNFDAQQDTTPWIGIWMEEEGNHQGIGVRHVFPSSPAARAGLRSGDVIVAIGDKKVASAQELINQISTSKPKETAQFSILREGQTLTVPVMIGQRGDYADVAMPQPEGNDQADRQAGMADDDIGSVPDHAMMLEQHRRFAEQHERIENLILELKEEVRQLREELRKRDEKPTQHQEPAQHQEETPAAP